MDNQNPEETEQKEQTLPASVTFSDQKIVIAVCLFLLLWASWRWIDLSRWGREEVEISRLAAVDISYQVDINQANWLEFAMLEGIGEVIAKRIIEYREQQGDFASIPEIRKVQGIGTITYEKIRPHLVLQPPAEKQAF